MKLIYPLALFGGFFLIMSCATFKPKYREDSSKNTYPEDKKIEQTFYLFGDGGNAEPGESTLALLAFKEFLKQNPANNNTALFLGDNIYNNGFEDHNPEIKERSEHKLNVQYEAVSEGVDKVYFIPGNHDWYAEGLRSLKLQEEYLKELSGDKDIFVPTDGCPIKSVDISGSILLLVLDTQWYLEDWNNHPKINSDCEIKTREKFFEEIEGELKKNQTKTILIAMHHPMYTNGVHGGKFALPKHLFPTQGRLPLPIISSLVTQVRTQGGVSRQDRYNEKYNELMTKLSVIVPKWGPVILLSGHEHNMQYIEDGPIKQVVSGSTSKASYGELGQYGLFSYGGQGFAVLDVFDDKSSWIRFYGATTAAEPFLLFETEVMKETEEKDFSYLPETFPPTQKAAVYDHDRTDKSAFFETLWGERYRDAYGTFVEAPVAMLDTLYGGLTPMRRGGGNQTKSLRLEDKDGKDYNMRGIKKNALQYIQNVIINDPNVPDDFKNTVTEDLVYDFYTAAHPFGAFAIPGLSEAIGLLHTRPQLYYVPKQKALGQYNEDYGDELNMIVERPHGKYAGLEIFDEADKIRSTDDLFAKLRKTEKNVIDENEFIKARLFDMLVGDWDRHVDQWRWAEFKGDDGIDVFVPIPRDRDQVFSNFDGAFLDVLRSLFGVVRQLNVYGEELTDTKWFNKAGIKLDRRLVQQSGREEWLAQAKFIQDNITDEIVDEAFKALPEETQGELVDDIKKNLKGRRDNLLKITEEYYQLLSGFQVVTATDKDDHIEITRKEDGITNIKVFRIKKGEKADVLLNRDYNRKDTREIWVYGKDDDDVFEVKGEGKKPIRIRIIGGQGEDVYNIENGKKIVVYDWRSLPSEIEKKGGARFKFLDDYDNNTYDINKIITTSSSTVPSVGFNPDDGFLIGLSNTFTIDGFQRNPFTQKHTLRGGYYFATEGFDLNYRGEFAKIIRRWNLLVGARLTSPTFAKNFFGFGNDTENPDDILGFDYNRVRWKTFASEVGLIRNSDFGSTFQFKVRWETIEIENSADRFIFLMSNSDSENRKYFGHAEASYAYRSFDNELNPTRGMLFDLIIGGTKNLAESRSFAYLKPRLGLYNAISRNRKLVLRSDVSAHVNFGNDFEFYQAAQLGGNTGLRAYRNERFSGNSYLLTSADLKYTFNSFRTGLIPVQIGIFTGYDGGRVWFEGEDSQTWHNSVGGGLFLIGADSVSATFNLFTGSDGARFSFGFGLSF